MNKINLTIILLLLNIIMQSQSIDNDKAHRRYWYYRTRMINDFMNIGKKQGDCIVFAERNATYLEGNVLESTVGPDQIDITNQYMMALALEYKLLSRNNQDVSETVKELFHLLYTFNRLDLEAEQFRGPVYPTHATDYITPNGILNGFALREDMPRSGEYFTANNNENLLHFNYELAEHNFPNTPNPTSGLCKVFLTNPNSVVSIEVVDAFAKSLFNINTISYSNDIDLSSFAKGVYSIIIRGNQGEVTIKKIVVQ